MEHSRRLSTLWAVFWIKGHHPHLPLLLRRGYLQHKNPTAPVQPGVPGVTFYVVRQNPGSLPLVAPVGAWESSTRSASCQEGGKRDRGEFAGCLRGKKLFKPLTFHFSTSINWNSATGPLTAGRAPKCSLAVCPEAKGSMVHGVVRGYQFALSPPNLQWVTAAYQI